MSPKTTPSAARVSAAAAVRPPDGPPPPRVPASAPPPDRPSPTAPAPSPCDGLAGPRAPGRPLCEPVAADGPSVTLTVYPVRSATKRAGRGRSRQAAAVRAARTPSGRCGPGMPPRPSNPTSGSRGTTTTSLVLANSGRPGQHVGCAGETLLTSRRLSELPAHERPPRHWRRPAGRCAKRTPGRRGPRRRVTRSPGPAREAGCSCRNRARHSRRPDW